MSGEALSPVRKRELGQIISEHHVAFELSPELGGIMGVLGKVGVGLKLFAVSSKPSHLSVPNCPLCKDTWHRLQELLRAVLPPDAPPRIYQFMPFWSHPNPVAIGEQKADVQALVLVSFPKQELAEADGSPLKAPLVLGVRALLEELGARDISQGALRS